jgi:hypothetical protein
MPPASSRATRQARYSASTAALAAGAAARVAISASQLRFRLALRLAREFRELHAEGRAELEQQVRRDGALIVLDEVQVAGGDAEALGEGGLGELGVLAQAANGAADGGCGHLDGLYKFSGASVNYLTGFSSRTHFPSVISQCNVNSSRPHPCLQEATP